MIEIQGIGLNSLCAIGKIHFYGHSESIYKRSKKAMSADGISTELQRLEIAFQSIEDGFYEGERSALHEELHDRARLTVFEGYEAAEAVSFAADHIFSELSLKGDPHISEMGTEIGRTASMILRYLSSEDSKIINFSPTPVILICRNISVMELSRADPAMILGLFLCGVDPLSELAIYAHSLGLPLIISEEDILPEASEGKMAIIDSEKGVLILSPDEGTVEHYGSVLCEIALNKGKKEKRLIYFVQEPSELEKYKLPPFSSLLIRACEKMGKEEHYQLFSSIIRELEGGELKIILPEEREKQKKVISAAIKASEGGKITLILPSGIDISHIRSLKYCLFSELEEESKNIAVGAVIDCGAAMLLTDKLAAEADFLVIDSDKLVSSLIFPRKAEINDSSTLETGCRTFLMASEKIIEEGKSKSAKVCFFGMISSKKDIYTPLLSLGTDEIAIPASYLL